MVIKSSRKRLVIRSADGIFAKQICYRGLRSLMKGVAGATACKEGMINLELARRGVSVPAVIAYGVVKRFGILQRDVLLTETVDDALSLDVFVVSRGKHLLFGEKQAFIKEFAHFIKDLHGRGIEHRDLHLGNILVQEETRPRFYLLDVDRVRLHGGELSATECARNLGLLLGTFQTLTRSLERFHFFRGYFDGARLREVSGKLEEIKQAALDVSLRVWRKRAGRCLHSNSRFVAGKFGHFKAHWVRQPAVQKALHTLLPNPDTLLNEGVLLKNGRTVRAARIEIDGRHYFLKRYNCKGHVYRIRNTLRRSRAVRTWLSTWNLTVRGVPVPKALICLIERRLGMLERSYILYEHVEGCRLCDIWPRLDEFGRKRCLAKLAVMLGTMHRFGGYHGDLKWPNILVEEGQGRFHITLTDLDGSRIYRDLPAHLAEKDITRFLADLDKSGECAELKQLFLETWRKWSH